jgi:hypothetical protein
MQVELPDIPVEQRTPLVEALLGIVRPLLDRVHELEATNQQLRDESALLKGQKPRPQLSPSILHVPAPPATPTPKERRRGKPTRPRHTERTLHREVTLHPPTLPEGATLKGYEPYVVQDLLIPSDNTRSLRARDELPQGGAVLAPLPAGVLPVEGGHFGANWVAYLLDQ